MPIVWSSPLDGGQGRGRLLAAIGVVALAVGLFAAWIGASVGGETSARYVDDLGTVLAALVATVMCLRAGFRHEERLRRFWWLLAAAAGAWTVAELTWAVYDLVLRVPVPVPSWADVGYLTAIPLAVAALLCHPAMHGSGVRKARAVFDALAVATALLFLSWTLVLGPLWQSTDMKTLGGIVALAYPFGDVVIVFFIVLAIRGMTRGDRLALWCLLGGLLVMALSDTTYAYLTGVKTYETGNLIDTGWVVGYLGIALGAFCSDARVVVAHRAEPPSPTLAQLVAPFLPVLVALSVTAAEIQLGHRLDKVGWMMAFGLVVLVLSRQGLLVLNLLAPSAGREANIAERLERAALGLATTGEVEAEAMPRP